MARTAGKRQEPRGKIEQSEAPTKRRLPTVDDQEESRFNPKILMAIGGGVLLLAFIVAIVAGLSIETPVDESMPQDIEVDIQGDSLPPFDPAAADPAIGTVAPEVTGIDFDEQPVSITHDGTPKAILFLAHWCPNCQAEVPAMQSYIDENGLPEGVELMSVATSTSSTRTNYPPSTWLESEGWTAPVLVDDAASSTGVAYGLTAFPFYVFVDGEGNVVGRVSGQQQPETIVGVMESLALGG